MAGIVAANLSGITVWPAAILTIIAFSATVILLNRKTSSPLAALTIFFFAASMTAATTTHVVMPHGRHLILTLNITETPLQTGRWHKTAATVSQYRLYNINGTDDDSGTAGDGTATEVWRKSNEKVVLRIDTSHRVEIGERLIVSGYAGELGTKQYEGYANLMRRRGYSASVWVDENQRVIALPEKHRTLRYYAARTQSAAAERLERLDINPDAMSIAAAMSIGERRIVNNTAKESYSKTGTSHLLSVSGLHVGIIAMLINALLWFIPAFRYGHIYKNVIAIVVIWLYAFITGLSPSVLRAAVMFTGAQVALASSRSSSQLNILMATAAVMLLANPNYLYDISFQLSFAAVAGIFLLYKPLYGMVKSRFKILNAFWSVFMVGLAATLSTTPLVSYYFGQIPIIGLIINPAVIMTANVVVLLSMIWIIIPFGVMNGIFSTAIGFCADLQNDIILSGASISGATLPVQLTLWQVGVIYTVTLTAYFLIYRYRSNKKQPDAAYDKVRKHMEED